MGSLPSVEGRQLDVRVRISKHVYFLQALYLCFGNNK